MTLWTSVDCACGKPPPRERDAMLLIKDKSLMYEAEVVDALIHAFDALTARVEHLELELGQIVSVLDRPLSAHESLDYLRQLREGLENDADVQGALRDPGSVA